MADWTQDIQAATAEAFEYSNGENWHHVIWLILAAKDAGVANHAIADAFRYGRWDATTAEG